MGFICSNKVLSKANKKSKINIELINILQSMADDPDEFVQSYATEKLENIFNRS